MSTDTRERIEVTEDELAGILLASIQSAKPIGITTETAPSCFYKGIGGSRKKDAEQCPPVVKRSRLSAMTCFSYENARNNDNAREWARQVETMRQEGREADADALEEVGPESHETHPRKWGERIQGTPFVRHTNRDGDTFLYVELMISTGNNPAWPTGYRDREYIHPTDPTIQYTLEDQEDDKISLRPWLKPHNRPDTDPHDFDYREVRLDHIKSVRTNGVEYVVIRPKMLIEAA